MGDGCLSPTNHFTKIKLQPSTKAREDKKEKLLDFAGEKIAGTGISLDLMIVIS